MGAVASTSVRLLPDGSPLRNRLLAALPSEDYGRIARDLRMIPVETGQTLQEHGAPVLDVFFPNGGVFSVTTLMNNGELVEVATVGLEGMLGASVFLGDLFGTGRTLRQVPNGDVPTLAVDHFVRESSTAGPFREIVARYVQANLLQVMQCTACNALHTVEQRCCRWLLQTHDRAASDDSS
jgi:CRP-like cAMP-binding protein